MTEPLLTLLVCATGLGALVAFCWAMVRAHLLLPVGVAVALAVVHIVARSLL